MNGAPDAESPSAGCAAAAAPVAPPGVMLVDAYGIERPLREIITGVFYDAKGARHEYAYTAVTEPTAS